MGELVQMERWLDKKGLAEHLSCSVRWIERQMEDGMPHTHFAGRAKFKASMVDRWLKDRGDIDWKGAA